jgi:hypothetical protein
MSKGEWTIQIIKIVVGVVAFILIYNKLTVIANLI